MYKPELDLIVPTVKVCLADGWKFLTNEARLIWANIIPHISYHLPALRCFAYTITVYALVVVPLVFLSKKA